MLQNMDNEKARLHTFLHTKYNSKHAKLSNIEGCDQQQRFTLMMHDGVVKSKFYHSVILIHWNQLPLLRSWTTLHSQSGHERYLTGQLRVKERMNGK